MSGMPRPGRLARFAGLAIVLSAALFASPAGASPLVEDTLPGFLATVADGSGESWVAYEASQSRTLDQLFFRDRSPYQKLAMARNALNWGVPLDQLRVFAARWRVDYDAVAPRVEALVGTPMPMGVSMWYASDPRTGVYGELDGKPTLALNARPMLPYDPYRTRLRIATEFFRVYQAQAGEPGQEAPTLSRRLQLAGLNLAAVQHAVPGLSGDRYLEVAPATWKQYERQRKAIARALLAALDGPESVNQAERFFGRGMVGDPWPPGAGRYMGLLLAREATRGKNPMELFVLPSQDYLFTARPQLEAMAGASESP